MTRSAPARPGVTAAVCTRNRTQALERALRSLVKQSTACAEILVVDNAPSDDATHRLVEQTFPEVRYLLEPRPGLNFARNAALRAAGTEIVAFLDDDAVADRDWCRAWLEVFGDDLRVGLCNGRVEALELVSPAQRLFEANGGFARGDRLIRLPRDAARPLHGRRAPLIAWAVSVGSGCSCAVRRALALQLGGYDEALDLGAALPGGGDHDMLWRVLQEGFDVVYDPRVQARHEHRRDWRSACDQIAGHQRGLVAFLVKSALQARGRQRLAVVAYLGWRLVKPGVRLLRRAVGRDPLPAGLLARLGWNSWAGLAAYPAGRRIAARRRRDAVRAGVPA